MHQLAHKSGSVRKTIPAPSSQADRHTAPRPADTRQFGVPQGTCACGGTCPACETERIQRKAARDQSPAAVPDVVHEVLRSPGQPLDSWAKAQATPE